VVPSRSSSPLREFTRFRWLETRSWPSCGVVPHICSRAERTVRSTRGEGISQSPQSNKSPLPPGELIVADKNRRISHRWRVPSVLQAQLFRSRMGSLTPHSYTPDKRLSSFECGTAGMFWGRIREDAQARRMCIQSSSMASASSFSELSMSASPNHSVLPRA
jgi:hypothetical protein